METETYVKKMASIAQPSAANRLFTAHTYDYRNSLPGIFMHWKVTDRQNNIHCFSSDYVVNYDKFFDLHDDDVNIYCYYLDKVLANLFTFAEIGEFIAYMWSRYGLTVIPSAVMFPLDVGTYDAGGNLRGIIDVRGDSFPGAMDSIWLNQEDEAYPLSFRVAGVEETGCLVDSIVCYSKRLKTMK